MRIGHYQLECLPGDYEANLRKVIAGLEEGDRQGIDIVSFPESFLTGYFAKADKAREHSFALDSAQIRDLLDRTRRFNAMFMVGFNERRGDELYNTVVVAERGELRGSYSKAFPCMDYFSPGRDFPLFDREGVKFGVVICADGGYIEPTRILALKGATIIFAPHYNCISKEGLLNHFQKVRSDHIARAVENGVWFVRGNNVSSGYDTGLESEGIGYGDSYVLDPLGEIVARSQRHVECLISCVIDTQGKYTSKAAAPRDGRSARSARELGQMLLETVAATERS